jgi:hypothetical protein
LTGEPIADVLRTALETATARTTDGHDRAMRLVAIGWATVELDRAQAQLSRALDVDGNVFRRAADSAALGASCRVAEGLLDGVDLAVVEPSTEGRLAAHLARHGEGPTIAWLADPSRSDEPHAAGTDGPFGAERFLPARGDGLVRLLVAASPGTIRP